MMQRFISGIGIKPGSDLNHFGWAVVVAIVFSAVFSLPALAAEPDTVVRVLTNHGTLLLDEAGFTADDLRRRGRQLRAGPLSMLSGGSLINKHAATIFGHGTLIAAPIENHGAIEFNGLTDVAGALSNLGTIRVTDESTTTFFGPVVNNGDSFEIEAGSRVVFLDRVSGTGAYTGAGEVIFNGTLAPGNSPGLLTIGGDITFGPFGTLEIEIGGLLRGTEYDALDVGGTATLDGTLDVLLINGFVPQAGDSFDIIIADTVVGQFATVQTPALNPGLFWVLDYDLDPSGVDTVRLLIDVDDDGDMIPNTQDNCTQVANGMNDTATAGPSQNDTDGDDFGNLCDADFNNNGLVDAQDFLIMRQNIGSSTAPDQDLNGNGTVDAQDFLRIRLGIGQPPGPSGLVP